MLQLIFFFGVGYNEYKHDCLLYSNIRNNKINNIQNCRIVQRYTGNNVQAAVFFPIDIGAALFEQ